jgi:phage shock protein A
MKSKVHHAEAAAQAEADLASDNVDERFAAMEKEGEVERLLAEIKSRRKAG